MTARRQAAVQPGRYGPRSAARGWAVSFTVSITTQRQWPTCVPARGPG